MALAFRNNRPVALREYAAEQTKDGVAWLRDYITAIKSGRFHPFTALERKAREATRNEAWYVMRDQVPGATQPIHLRVAAADLCIFCYRGPTGTLLNELADASFDAASCEIIFVSPSASPCQLLQPCCSVKARRGRL